MGRRGAEGWGKKVDGNVRRDENKEKRMGVTSGEKQRKEKGE